MVIYAPGTEETDQKKQNMALQQLAAATTTNTTNIATNTTDIATNAAAIAAIGVANKGYFLVNRNAVGGSGTAAAYNKILFTTEVKDSQNWFDNATNYRFQPLESGYYYFVVSASSAGNTGGTSETCQAAIYKNGASAIKGPYLGLTATLISAASGLVFLNGSTDYVEGMIYLPTGVTTYSGQVDNLFMLGWKVGT